jgi:hypothetical protein
MLEHEAPLVDETPHTRMVVIFPFGLFIFLQTLAIIARYVPQMAHLFALVC